MVSQSLQHLLLTNMQLVDTHCHIHSADYPLDVDEVLDRAQKAGIGQLICVGTDVADSELAVVFAKNHDNCMASLGVHPHEALQDESKVDRLRELASDPTVVAIGECGLDYFYEHSPRDVQARVLRKQIEIALKHDLPMIFHVRDAFDDFWPIFDEYKGICGVLHSFTDTQENADKALGRGLLIGINGIMTFTKNQWQLDIAKTLPLEKVLFETDAPFLTPKPLRGTMNEPAHVGLVASFMAELRGISPEAIATATANNARQLFSLK